MMTDLTSGANASGYRVLARKYRPKSFADLIGHEAMVRTLANAFTTNRIAQAYMLTGVRGVGKTTTARLIARALNYPDGPTTVMPTITSQCEAILESRHMDVIEMDAASNTGVDDMREIIDSVRYAPAQARYKVYIIDEVHMLSKNAFNALLKTLEEPPAHVKFIFATTEIRKVPVTILSRCQRFDLKRFDAALLMQHYGKIAALEAVTIDDGALSMIARAAEGSVRDGLSLLDQAIAYGPDGVNSEDVAQMLGLMDRSRVVDLFASVMAGNPAKALAEAAVQYDAGGDPQTILTDLAEFTHWVTRIKVVGPSALNDPAFTEVEKTRGAEFAAGLSLSHLTKAWQMLLKGITETALAHQPMMAAEMVLIRLCHASTMPSGEELVKLITAVRAESSPSPAPAKDTVQPFRQNPSVAEQRSNLAIKPDATPPWETTPPPTTQSFANFADIVALAVEKRDIKLKTDMERYVRPIRVAPGQITMALEPDASPGLPGEITRKLEAWTSRRWIVSVQKDGGDEPLAKQRKDAKDVARRDVLARADVQEILQKFPGSEVTKVIDPEPLHSPEEPEDEYR
jgi:DNA polymerase III subunit gamma/tau